MLIIFIFFFVSCISTSGFRNHILLFILLRVLPPSNWATDMHAYLSS